MPNVGRLRRLGMSWWSFDFFAVFVVHDALDGLSAGTAKRRKLILISLRL